MKRLPKGLAALFRRVKARADKGTSISREDALVLIRKLAQEHDIPHYIFKDREAADRFIRDI